MAIYSVLAHCTRDYSDEPRIFRSCLGVSTWATLLLFQDQYCNPCIERSEQKQEVRAVCF